MINEIVKDKRWIQNQYFGYSTCVSKRPNLYLACILYLLNLSSGLNLAGCAFNVYDPSSNTTFNV